MILYDFGEEASYAKDALVVAMMPQLRLVTASSAYSFGWVLHAALRYAALSEGEEHFLEEHGRRLAEAGVPDVEGHMHRLRSAKNMQ